MPSRKIHKKLSKALLGNSCDITNKAIDYPVKFFGKGHRALFHDPLSAAAIGYFFEGYDGAASGLLHLAVDKVCSKYPLIRKILEYSL